MNEWVHYGLLFALIALFGGKSEQGSDVGKLQPVQVVRVSSDAGAVQIETDTGDFGSGISLKEALEDLEKTSSAEVFLDTADYLIVTKECKGLLSALTRELRPSCAVCVEDGKTDMEQVAAFLEYHKPKVTLMHCKAGQQKFPILRTNGGRMELVS